MPFDFMVLVFMYLFFFLFESYPGNIILKGSPYLLKMKQINKPTNERGRALGRDLWQPIQKEAELENLQGPLSPAPISDQNQTERDADSSSVLHTGGWARVHRAPASEIYLWSKILAPHGREIKLSMLDPVSPATGWAAAKFQLQRQINLKTGEEQHSFH